MPKRKSLLKRIEVETAKGKRTCKFSGTSIAKGEKCVLVYNAPRDYKGYCRDVALQMINDAKEQLKKLENSLS